jgi:hypothetical protein
VTVSEFLFLAIGLVLGVASGAALVEIIRARPPARREVVLTVSRDAIPRRRASTLADDAFVTVGPEPARGGPADRRDVDDPTAPAAPDRRTNVLTGGHPARNPREDARGADNRPVGVPISAGADPMLDALRASGQDRIRSQATPNASRGEASDPTGRASGRKPLGTIGLLDRPGRSAAGSSSAPAISAPCAEERSLADERCELASRAQAQAVAAADALRRAQRAYEAHTSASTAAADAAHPLAVRSLKEGAQRAFRAASKGAKSAGAIEVAARTWLQEINRINREAAAARLGSDHESAAAASIGASLERLSLEADAARVGASMADAACLAARSAVADCDERAAAGSSGGSADGLASSQAAEPAPAGLRSQGALGIALETGTAPRIFRLLHGDPEAMDSLVASLAGDEPADQRRWKLALAGLLDAILADAIEQAYLRYPHDHPFWGPYTQEQNRDITRALASLGHRFDGLGGWAGERLPSQRELSLALGYAGLDPMRMRQWPNEQQTAELLRNVVVAADEYLAGVAGNMTLAEMVDMLGRRADGLVELWNQWGRLRPLLLDEA